MAKKRNRVRHYLRILGFGVAGSGVVALSLLAAALVCYRLLPPEDLPPEVRQASAEVGRCDVGLQLSIVASRLGSESTVLAYFIVFFGISMIASSLALVRSWVVVSRTADRLEDSAHAIVVTWSDLRKANASWWRLAGAMANSVTLEILQFVWWLLTLQFLVSERESA